MTFPQPANHDRRCQVCERTGWEQAAPLKSKANGFDVEYTQLVPCTNEHWWQDDPDVDEWGYNRTVPISRERGIAIARTTYADQCARYGRTPDWSYFEQALEDQD